MKKIVLMLFILSINIALFASTDTIFRPSEFMGRERFSNNTKSSTPFNGHLAGIYVGFADFVNTDYTAYQGNAFMNLHVQRSYTIALHFIEFNIGIQRRRNTIGFVSALGAEWQNLSFSHPTTIRKDRGGIITPTSLNDGKVKVSRLRQLNLLVPLLLEFQIPSRSEKRIHLSAGMVGSFRLLSQTKFKITETTTPYREQLYKRTEDYNIRDYRLDGMAQMGNNRFSLWVKYGLTPFFKKEKGPEIHLLNFGAAILF